MFDIAVQGLSDGHISHHQPVGSAVKLEVKLKAITSHGSSTSSSNHGSSSNTYVDASSTISCYSPNWVTFIPDIVIDAKQGLMWRIQIKLDSSLSRCGINKAGEFHRLEAKYLNSPSL